MGDYLPALDPDRDLCGQENGDSYIGWMRHALDRPWDIVTSYNVESPTSRQLVLSICDSDCIRGCDHIGECFYIGHFILHPAEARNNDTGELQETVRSVWPQPEGLPWSFGSKTLIKAVQKIQWANGMSNLPWEPPVKVRLKQRRGGKGHVYYLEIVRE